MSDQGLHLFIDRSPLGMYRSTAGGALTYVNAACARLLGYTVEELLAKNLERDIAVDPDVRRRRVAAYTAGTVIDGVEDRWRHRDGRVLHVQLWGHVVQTEAGLSFDAAVIDVTEVHRQREQLERTARTLDQVVRQMPALYWLIDKDLRITHSGGPLRDLLDPGGQFVGVTIHDVATISTGQNDIVGLHARALAGETVAFEGDFRGRLLANIVSPYRDPTGEIVGAIGTALDVTHWRMLERRMVDAQRAESLGLLAGGLAHDFNNLLVAVIGNADLALRDLPDGLPGRPAIETIRDTGLRAAELTQQLLTVAGRGPAGTTRVYPAVLVDELVRITAPSVPASIKIDVDVPTQLALRGDPQQLRQVVLNLIANARDALLDSRAGGGAIAIRARLVAHDGGEDAHDVLSPTSGAYVALDVTDDGPGMTTDVRRHVFDPFFTTKDHGHGLGLAAVLGIMRAHGGGLRLVSRPGAGATFTVMWPAAVTAPTRPPTPPPIAAPKVVLVVDDEDLVRDVVARMIEDLGYGVVTARDGKTALELLEHRAVDAVLVDMTMPRMSGADVIAALRVRHPGVPVILCSGFDRGGHGPTAADAYLPKPFRIEALERTLAKLLPS